MTPVVFDLDGTLIHSMPDILAAAQAFLADHDKTGLLMDEALQYVGNGVPHLVARLCEAYGLATGPERVPEFLAHYEADPISRSKPYSGVVEALESLKQAGHPLGVCTNKPEAPAQKILTALGLSPYFSVVIGGDSLASRKPDPAPLRAAFDALGGEGIFVGDSEVDAETATRAKIPFILYEHGYRKTPPSKIPHDILMPNFAALPDLVHKI